MHVVYSDVCVYKKIPRLGKVDRPLYAVKVQYKNQYLQLVLPLSCAMLNGCESG